MEATLRHLQRVERAENIVREKVKLELDENMRVRLLARKRLAIEVDEGRIGDVRTVLDEIVGALRVADTPASGADDENWASYDDVAVRAFKSGSLSVLSPIKVDVMHTKGIVR